MKPISLGGDLGKDVLPEFDNSVDKLYEHHPALSLKYDFERDVVTNASPFSMAVLNPLLEKRGFQITGLEELMHFHSNLGLEILDSTYSGIVFQSLGFPNPEISRYFMNILSEEQRKKIKFPFMADLRSLEVGNLPDSEHGLYFSLREGAKVLTSPVLKMGRKIYFDNVGKCGFPISKEKGKYRWFNADAGVYSVCVGNVEDFGAITQIFDTPLDYLSEERKKEVRRQSSSNGSRVFVVPFKS